MDAASVYKRPILLMDRFARRERVAVPDYAGGDVRAATRKGNLARSWRLTIHFGRMETWRFIHMLALAWLGAGLGSTYPLILRAWSEKKDINRQAQMLIDAANNETRILLPGAMATGITGFFWAVSQEELNFAKDGWLLALSISFVFFYFICLPLLGFGLRRARIAALIAQKKGEVTPELKEILDDRVPVVFSTLLVISVPLLAWLAVYKPF